MSIIIVLERLGCNPLEVLAMIAINDKDGLGEEKDILVVLRQKAASDLMPSHTLRYFGEMMRIVTANASPTE